MTNFNNDDKTITIPNFLDDKDTTDSSVDMSIFKMSDEELYDDVPKKDDKKKSPKKKGNSTVVLCLVVIGVLIAALAICGVMAISKSKAYTTEHDKVTQLEASNKDLNTKVTSLEAEVTTLQNKIKELEASGTTTDTDGKYKSGTTLYITQDGHEYAIREKTSLDSAKGETLYWGESITLIADAVKDADGNYWGKISGGYFPIVYGGVEFASVEKQ